VTLQLCCRSRRIVLGHLRWLSELGPAKSLSRQLQRLSQVLGSGHELANAFEQLSNSPRACQVPFLWIRLSCRVAKRTTHPRSGVSIKITSWLLTVRNSEGDKIAALDAGADDFVTKPFSTPELLARIRATLRRVQAPQSSLGKVRVGQLLIDFGARTVINGTAHLTPKELDLLRHLTHHPNQALSHRELLQAVRGPDYGDQVDYLRVFIKNLRKKIELNPEHPEYITTEPTSR
jgi:CheY-like chemotaxis protein